MFYINRTCVSPSAKLLRNLISASHHQDQEMSCYGRSQLGEKLLMFTQITESKIPTLMIVAGTHGDEIAGVLAAAKFWIKEAPKYHNQVNFVYYPCVNPDGYNVSSRTTFQGEDINRQFYFNTNVPEALLLMRSMGHWGDKIDFLLNLHEDNPMLESDIGGPDIPKGAYLYLHGEKDHNSRIANRIVNHWKSHGHRIHSSDRLYDSRVNEGIIDCTLGSENRQYEDVPLLDNLVSYGEKCMSITIETIMTADLKERVQMQYEAIKATVDYMTLAPALDKCCLFG